LRSRYDFQALHRQEPRNWLTLRDASKELGLHHTVVQRLIEQGILPAKQAVPLAPWVIERNGLVLPEVKSAIDALKSGRVARRRSATTKTLAGLSLFYEV